MKLNTVENVHVVQSDLLLEAGLPHGWFGAELGNTMYRQYNTPEYAAAVKARWAEACRLLGMDALKLVRTTGLLQTDIVQDITADQAGGLTEEGDGYVTRERGLPVMLRAADCIQAIVFDPRAMLLGIVHAGGLGTSRGIMPATIQRMQQAGAHTQNMLVGMGPSIAPEHFVPTQEKDNFTLADIAASHPITVALPDNRIGYDVAATNVQRLLELGISEHHIDRSTIDTFSDRQFFSYERDYVSGDQEAIRQGARHGLFVALPPNYAL